MNGRRSRGRRPLDVSNPVDLMVEMIVWRLRSYGRQVITGVVLLAGLFLLAACLFIPLVVAGLLIAVFGLAVEPYKWVGTILIVVALVVGVVAAPLILRHVVSRGARLIRLTELGDADTADAVAAPPSPSVPPEVARAEWSAKVRAMDERLASTTDPNKPGS